MPSRYAILAILAFWLTTAGWLFWRDVYPWTQAGSAPQIFRADFSDEVRASEIRWLILRDQKPLGSPFSTLHGSTEKDHAGSGSTTIRRRKDRTYAIETELKFQPPLQLDLPRFPAAGLTLMVSEINSSYATSPKNEMRALGTKVTLEGSFAGVPFSGITVAMDGTVKDGWFFPSARVNGWGASSELVLDPVEVAVRERFFNPMLLFKKEPDLLSEGQTWKEPAVDPLAEAALQAASKYVPQVKSLGNLLGNKLQVLIARVGSGVFEWDGTRADCWMIDVAHDPAKKEVLARTWVRKSDQWILGREMPFQKSRLVIVRLIWSRGAAQ